MIIYVHCRAIQNDKSRTAEIQTCSEKFSQRRAALNLKKEIQVLVAVVGNREFFKFFVPHRLVRTALVPRPRIRPERGLQVAVYVVQLHQLHANEGGRIGIAAFALQVQGSKYLDHEAKILAGPVPL